MNVSIIARKDKLFFHFGILLSSGRVLHFASKTNNMFARNQTVREDSFNEFSIQRQTKILCQIPDIEDSILIQRAIKYWGQNMNYSLSHNNCITFIIWCLYGKSNLCFKHTFYFYIKHHFLLT